MKLRTLFHAAVVLLTVCASDYASLAHAGDTPDDWPPIVEEIQAGNVPSGFQPTDLPPLTEFQDFTVIPLAAFANSTGKQILAYSLVAKPGKRVPVEPKQFYRPGIVYIQIEGHVVNDEHSPTMYVVMQDGT